MSTAPGFNELLRTMAEQDFFTGIFPFLLTYVLIYLALGKIPIFDASDDDSIKNPDRFRALVSVIFGFFVANFMVMNPAYQAFFASYLSRIVIGVVGILGLMVFLALIPGFDMERVGARIMVVLILFGAAAAFGISGGLSAFLPQTTVDLTGIVPVLDYVFESGLIYLLVIGGALLWVTGGSNDSGKWKKRVKWGAQPVGNGGG